MSTEATFLEGSVRDFLDRLASRSPVPGGGSVAALAGALAAGLVSMVANLTLSSPRCAEVHPHAKVVLERSELLRAELEGLVEEDARAFLEVSKALKMSKETEDEKRVRQACLQKALARAMQVPLAVGERATAVAELAAEAARIGNVNAVSDAGVAAALALAATRAAELNVAINAAMLDDRRAAGISCEQAAGLLRRAADLEAAALETTFGRIG